MGMNQRAIVATHHKTGSVWMASVFRAIGRAHDIPLISLTVEPDVASRPPPVIIQDSHSKWYHERARAGLEHRMIHVIRDPRDVILSAMRYHQRATEKWLHVPRERFGGHSYQDAINALADDRARCVFEMDNNAGHVTRALTRWNYARPECFEAKYEELMADTDMSLFTRAAAHLGFAGAELETCGQAFWENSLFGGKRRKVAKMKHVSAGGGRQWETVFDRALGEAFVERFGDALIVLGYEPDNTWVGRLPEKAA
jgi:hypothetical protein